MKSRSGFCSHSDCAGKKETLIFNRWYMLCRYHNDKRLGERKRKVAPKKYPNYRLKKPIERKRKVTGELELFKKLSLTRIHCCAVCGQEIKELRVHNFAHILSKGSHPSLRLNEENILIMCWNIDGDGCHSKWDTKAHSDLETDGRWQKVFNLADKLKKIR